jgi:hypothetical protein
VLDRLRDDDTIVPPMWQLEVINALLVAETRGRHSEAQAARLLTLLAQLLAECNLSAPGRWDRVVARSRTTCHGRHRRGRGRGREVGDELIVLAEASLRVSLPTPFPHLAIDQALLLGLRNGVGLGEDALPLVPLAGPTPLHDDRGQPGWPASPGG